MLAGVRHYDSRILDIQDDLVKYRGRARGEVWMPAEEKIAFSKLLQLWAALGSSEESGQSGLAKYVLSILKLDDLKRLSEIVTQSSLLPNAVGEASCPHKH